MTHVETSQGAYHLIIPWYQIGAEKTLFGSVPQKLNSFIYPLDKIYQTTILSTSMTHTSSLLLHRISFTKNLNWKSDISSPAKSSSKKLGILCLLHQFFSPYQLLTIYSSLSIQTTIPSTWMTHICLLHWTFLGYLLLKLLIESLISPLL